MERMLDVMSFKSEKLLVHIENNILTSLSVLKNQIIENLKLRFDSKIIFGMVLKGDDKDYLFVLNIELE